MSFFLSKIRESKAGLTTLELLIVIALMGVVLVLLMPLGGRLREASLMTQCLSNLRQIGIAMNFYVTEHHQTYPPTYSAVRNPPNLKTWMAEVGPYAGYPANAMGNGTQPRAVGIFLCPKLSKQEQLERKVGYFYNGEIVTSIIRRAPLGLKTFLVMEGVAANSEAVSKASFISNLPQRHLRKQANVLYVDGSVETLQPPIYENDPRWKAAAQ